MVTSVEQDVFGHWEGIPVLRFTLKNPKGSKAQIITFGASVSSLQIPDRNGKIDDVVLGFDDLDGYLGVKTRNPYFGAVVGRVANRIAKGKITVDGKEYSLPINNGENHLHGGPAGFGKVLWEPYVHQDGKLTLSYSSRDGDEGYPGQVLAQVTYELTEENELRLDFKALTTKACPINLASHSYFNLASHDAGADALNAHKVIINADYYTPLDSTQIPTGEIRSVEGSTFDLRVPTLLSFAFACLGTNGFDHNFVINQTDDSKLNFVGRFEYPANGRVMEVFSDQPGVQFYTGNFLPKEDDASLLGKNRASYHFHGGFCMETQNFPNAINQPNFPNSIVKPGEVYSHRVIYRFSSQ